jgi:hypothetical protein
MVFLGIPKALAARVGATHSSPNRLDALCPRRTFKAATALVSQLGARAGRGFYRVRLVECALSVHREPSGVHSVYMLAVNRLQDSPKAEYLSQIYMVAPIEVSSCRS